MKFGGTSVADLERIASAAQKIALEAHTHEVIVIVSAMAGQTNHLEKWVKETHTLYDRAEYDAVCSSGETVTAGLMALKLQEMGLKARSFQGWQVPLQTDGAHQSARICEIPTDTLDDCFKDGLNVAVIAGFQGISPQGRITTLGRGGSDTTAVAFAAAFKAVRCDIYTDVDGIYTTDPRIEKKARKKNRISFEEMLELASLGAKVLQTRSVELAMRYRVKLRVLSSFDDDISETMGTYVCAEEEIMEHKIVEGIAYSRDEAKITLQSVADRPGVASAIFGVLGDAHVNVDMIIQNISDNGRTDMTFSCPLTQIDHAKTALHSAQSSGLFNFKTLIIDDNIAKVSIVGIGMRSQTGVASKMFKTLAEANVNIQVISTSEIKISVLVDRDFMELAVRKLHDAFELEHPTS